MTKKIAAVVVTYNRELLLLECLNSLKNQSYKLDAIFIIDNNSDERTPLLLIKEGWIEQLPSQTTNKNEVLIKTIDLHKTSNSFESIYVRKKENDGGAGGFYEGIKLAYSKGYDLIWIMDDDVVPLENSLKELINALHYVGNFGFLCSRVVGNNGISMNLPEVDDRLGDNYYPVWDELLEHGLVKVKSATFVSVLIPFRIVKDVGYPLREMFIWGDDIEYTLRVSQNYPCYIQGKSIVCHKREISKPPSIKYENDRKRIKMHFYSFRNSIFYTRKHKSILDLIILFTEIISKFIYLFIRLRFFSIRVMIKGAISGLFFNPEIDFPDN